MPNLLFLFIIFFIKFCLFIQLCQFFVGIYLCWHFQVRPASSNVSSGTPDKTQFARTELWTKDVIEYLNHLLDDFFSKDGFSASASGRDHLLQTALPGLAQQRTDSASSTHDVEEPLLQFKWWYMVRLLNWHYAEGLLLPSVIIEWVLNQLQVIDLLAFAGKRSFIGHTIYSLWFQ